MAFSPCGKLIATLTFSDNKIRLWNIATGSVHAAFNGSLGRIGQIVFSQNGKLVASASDEEDVVKLWDSDIGGACAMLKTQSELVGLVE